MLMLVNVRNVVWVWSIRSMHVYECV